MILPIRTWRMRPLRHFLRRQLAVRVSVYRIPELHFEADLAPELANRVGHLLKRVKRGRPKDEGPKNSPAG